MIYIIDNGTQTNMWTYPWLSIHPPQTPRPLRGVNPAIKTSNYFNVIYQIWLEYRETQRRCCYRRHRNDYGP
ncbi:hypothetical protein YC2023_089753 [Brassica napus]